MALNYRKHKNAPVQESFWTSYSDLFLGLSSIFLLLYVTSSLRSGTDGIKAQAENQKLQTQITDLKNQLKIYEQIKDEQLQSGKDEELQEYKELMDKLTLLQENARDEKDGLRKRALENEAKERALNKYQQLVRNIVNANKLAQSKISNRNKVIEDQDTKIDDQGKRISELKTSIQQKQNMISEGEAKIAQAQQELEARTAELKHAYKKKKMTEKAYQTELERLRENTGSTIAKLETDNSKFQGQVLVQQQRLQDLAGQVEGLNKNLAKTGEELKETQGKLHQTQGTLDATQSQLVQARAELAARKSIAKDIKERFAKAGVKADVNGETGEVTIDFGDSYFATDSSKLTGRMRDVLAKVVPSYASALLGNAKAAKRIANVEIIGFASPTYRGKYVDPTSNADEERQALKYNMDLSYRRARSIFNYVLDAEKNTFQHQKELVPLLKVSGRSFLEVLNVDREQARMDRNDFCQKHDCRKAQRVIIRFNMHPK